MADGSKIEWTDATWNIVTGCSVVSPGCTNCYAMRNAGTRLRNHPSRVGLTRESKAGPVWTGDVRFNEQWLTQPLGWTKPRLIFVAAHGDLFHEAVPDAWIDRVFAVMALAPQHTFQVLTKRSARMRAYFEGCGEPFGFPETPWGLSTDWTTLWHRRRAVSAAIGDLACAGFADRVGRIHALPLPNVWLGVSAEDQRRYDERAPDLKATLAAVHFFSFEPLLGPIKAGYLGDWAIVGGESGPGARPMHPQWPRDIRDQCATAGVPFHFKQWGAWVPTGDWYADHPVSLPIRAWTGAEWTDDGSRADLEWVARVGKSAAGRLLDGREHSGMPGVAA